MEIVIVGATGNVGRNVVKIMSNDHDNIICTGSARSAGTRLKIRDKDFIIHDTETFQFKEDQISIFNTDAEISAKYIPRALAAGGYVVDSSSYYRMNKDVPLIVPYIGKVDIKQSKLFAHANCIVSPIASIIYPLHKKFNIERVIISTYQATAGAGKAAMDECFAATKQFCNDGIRNPSQSFARSIAFNIIPQIGQFNSDGVSSEEEKICQELRKILDKNLYISATSVRVPVLFGHSVSLSLRFNGIKAQVIEILQSSPRIVFSEDYCTPIEVAGEDKIFVSRIRSDKMGNEQWFHIWLCADSLRIGAADDACYIANAVIKKVKL